MNSFWYDDINTFNYLKYMKYMNLFKHLPLGALIGLGILLIGALFLIGQSVKFLGTSLVGVSDSELQKVKISPHSTTLEQDEKEKFLAFGVFNTGEVRLRVEWDLDPEDLGELDCGEYTDECLFTAGDEVSSGYVGIAYGDLIDKAKVKITVPVEVTFSDVPSATTGEEAPWYIGPVQKVAKLGLMQGSDGKFGIGQETTRADTLLIIYRLLPLLGVEIPKESQDQNCNAFNDVPSDHYAAQAICTFWKMEWVQGIDPAAKILGVNKPVTRSAAAKLIVNALGDKIDTLGQNQYPEFNDVPIDYWGYPFIKRLAEAEILRGISDGKFDPEGKITREQLATIINRLLEALGQ